MRAVENYFGPVGWQNNNLRFRVDTYKNKNIDQLRKLVLWCHHKLHMKSWFNNARALNFCVIIYFIVILKKRSSYRKKLNIKKKKCFYVNLYFWVLSVKSVVLSLKHYVASENQYFITYVGKNVKTITYLLWLRFASLILNYPLIMQTKISCTKYIEKWKTITDNPSHFHF